MECLAIYDKGEAPESNQGINCHSRLLLAAWCGGVVDLSSTEGPHAQSGRCPTAPLRLANEAGG